MTRYLITGSAGFIGYHVAHRMIQRGDEVIGIDNLNDYYDVRLKEARLAQLDRLRAGARYRFLRLDVADRDGMSGFFREYRPDVVIHLAAQAGVRYSLTNPYSYADSNLLGFLNILEGCRHNHVQHLVYASSSSVYGANMEMPFRVTDRVDNPISLYAATKKANELMAHAYSHLYGIPTTGLRFFTVYGPWGRPDMAYFSFTNAILEGEPIRLFNHGNLKRDFTYIDDIVEGVLRTADLTPAPQNVPGVRSNAPYRLYNIGNNRPVELLRFVEILEETIGLPAIKQLTDMQPGDVYTTFADIDDLKSSVGFCPTTPIEVGIANFVAWFRTYYNHAV